MMGRIHSVRRAYDKLPEVSAGCEAMLAAITGAGEAALRGEVLWRQLTSRFSFSLVCLQNCALLNSQSNQRY
jgi:hypothetical protein